MKEKEDREKKMKVFSDKIVIENSSFNVVDTLQCGQVFSYKILEDGTIFVVSGRLFAKIVVDKKNTTIYSSDIDYFYNFFDLSTDYERIKKELCKIYPKFDKYLFYGKNLRILRQDPLQTTISFIVSSNNNIKRITKTLHILSERFGEKIAEHLYSFPTLNALKKITKDDFTQMGCGYRSDYLVKTIKMLCERDFDMDYLKTLKTPLLRQKLMTLCGVGKKVADCILFFGFSRTDVFPVDTWIRKAYKDFCDIPRTDEKISDYFVSIFGKLSGYAQQYIYNYMLFSEKKS